MKILLSGLIGAIIGAVISGFVAYRIFNKEVLTEQYVYFVDEIDKALVYAKQLKSPEIDEKTKTDLEFDLNLSLSKAWSKALVTLPDEVFQEIDRALDRETLGWKERNRIYFLMRKQLYPDTEVIYDDIMNRSIKIVPPQDGGS